MSLATELENIVTAAAEDARAARLPFPIQAVPEPARSFLRENADAIGCPVETVACGLFPALATVARLRFFVTPKRGWPENLLLWSAVIGESGTLKTPALKAGVSPLRELQTGSNLQYEKVRDEIEAMPKDDRPDMPPRPRYIATGTTPEALAARLEKNRTLLLFADELAGFVSDFGRYASGKKGGDAETFMQFYEGTGCAVERKGEEAAGYCDHGGVCICGGIQPAIFEKTLGGDFSVNGFLQRVLVVFPDETEEPDWNESEVSEGTANAMRRVFRNLDLFSKQADGAVGLRFSKGPDSVWVGFFNRNKKEVARATGFSKSVTCKTRGLVCRFATMFHLVKHAERLPDDAVPPEIDEGTMRDAVTVAEWFRDEQVRVHDHFIVDSAKEKAARLAERVLRIVQEHPDGVPLAGLHHELGGHTPAAELRGILATLERAGHCVSERSCPDGSGKPTTVVIPVRAGV